MHQLNIYLLKIELALDAAICIYSFNNLYKETRLALRFAQHGIIIKQHQAKLCSLVFWCIQENLMKKIILYTLPLIFFTINTSSQAANQVNSLNLNNQKIKRIDVSGTTATKKLNGIVTTRNPPRLLPYMQPNNSSRFVKLVTGGLPRPARAKKWSCVLDNQTGLVWERKHPTSGPSWWNTRYPNTSNTTAQITRRGRCVLAPDNADLVRDPTCHTKQYVIDANKGVGLCGYKNWRMPTAEELSTIITWTIDTAGQRVGALNFSNPKFFPYPKMRFIWTNDGAIGGTQYEATALQFATRNPTAGATSLGGFVTYPRRNFKAVLLVRNNNN